MSRYPLSLFIFRRDLRLEDNRGLNAALTLSRQVLPCFIFDPRQIQPHPYQSLPALHFMQEALADLQAEFAAVGGELAFFHDAPCQVIGELFARHGIGAVFTNRDYSPFSRQRDREMAELCRGLGIDFHSVPDALLNEPEAALKADGSVYKVFTPFYQRSRQIPVALPEKLAGAHFFKIPGNALPESVLVDTGLAEVAVHGGRRAALALFDALERLDAYQQQRDFPSLDATSRLSAHLKFGCCSAREAYYAVVERLGEEHPLLRQLYWRDFFTHIAYHFPQVFGHAFQEKFENVEWDNRDDYFAAWCEGRTGFPIVDAGMRELNATGFMHNRTRMITASFLVKDLHIDWRWGERYFARHLVDYDPCVNNGNWQWAASTGCDAQPYFRIFNPWLQQVKFDPDCAYLYRWLPEVRRYGKEVLHNWNKRAVPGAYPAPLVDHAIESGRAKERFSAAAEAMPEPVADQSRP